MFRSLLQPILERAATRRRSGLRCRGANCYRSDRCATTSVTTFHTAPIWEHSVRSAPIVFPTAPPNLEPREDIWPTEPAPVFRRREDGVELVQLRWGF